MIILRGTSHVATGDLDGIRELVAAEQPDVVALELDQRRLQVLLSGTDTVSLRYPFMFVLKQVQDLLGRTTGSHPGADMLAAFNTAAANGIDAALIDRDITDTLKALQAVPLGEKIKFIGFLIGGLLVMPLESLDLREVPETGMVHRMLVQFEVSFPQMYDALITQRNREMAARLIALDERYDTVLAFVGAGHIEGLTELLEPE